MNEMKTNPQLLAVSIEHTMRIVFKCDRGGVGGLVDADYIRKHPYAAICCALTSIYMVADDTKKKQIESYIEKYIYYSEWSIDEMLSFKSSTKTINGIEYQIEFENGKEAFDNMKIDFEALVG